MAFGTSNRVALRYVMETVWGTTPASPAMQALRFTSESLNYNADFITSDEIRSDRMTADTIQVSSSGGGDISGELSYATYDDFIMSVMFSDWYTTGSVEAAQTDISITKTGGTPNTWTIDSAALADFTDNNIVVGQLIEVTGFTTAGTFQAIVTTISTLSLGMQPLTDVASESAGDSVTVTPMDHIRNGVVDKSMTIQKEYTDLTTPEFLNFAGSKIGSMSVELSTGSILTMGFSMLAKDAAMTETQFASATEPAANTNDVLNAVDNVAAVVFDGDPGATAVCFNSLSIEMNNNLRGQEAVSSLALKGVVPSRISLTGNIELYFENSTEFDKFRAATAFSLTFKAVDTSSNYYVFHLPRVKYTNMEIAAGGLDQDVFASGQIEVIADATGTYMIQVSRS